jgi:hypothetical protein
LIAPPVLYASPKEGGSEVRKEGNGMKPDITKAYGILHRDYSSMCRWQNAVQDEFGIKKVEVKELGKNRGPGLVLAMTGPSCSYELQLQNEMMLLGRFYQGRRQLVCKGSPSLLAGGVRSKGNLVSEESIG